MSLFAADPTFLAVDANALTTEPAAERSTADLLASVLPDLVSDALGRGHVRSAAMYLEQALDVLPLDHPAMQRCRWLIDQCAAQDAAIQQRQIAGEMLVVPSLTERAAGLPRFHMGLTRDELSLPIVQAFLRDERRSGHAAELRNFLDEALLSRDAFIDLDPGVGTGVLTAMTATSGPVIALQRETALRTLLMRNAVSITSEYHGTVMPTIVDSIADAVGVITPSRTVLHLGAVPVAAMERHLERWAQGAIAVAWDASDRVSAECAQRDLEQWGLSSFMLAQDEEGMSLQPFRIGAGALTAFALSDGFIASLGGEDGYEGETHAA